MDKEQDRMEKKNWCISTNKLLYEIFNYTYSNNEIKTKGTYVKNEYGKREYVEQYYIDFNYEEFKGNLSKVRVSSTNKDNLRFTIHEQLLYYMLISNARQSNEKGEYYISMRKIRNIRGLQGNSLNTYKCYEDALNRLSAKNIMVLPLKSTYQQKIISCNMITISNVKLNNNRIYEFKYCFNDLDNNLVKNKQRFVITYNPFEFMFKKYFSFLVCLHITRLIALNNNNGIASRKYSFQKILLCIHKVNGTGVIEDVDYYHYIENAGNKQSAYLNKCYEDTENILKMLVKHKYIKDYNISSKRTFKYLRDNEVYLMISFMR